MAIRAWILTGLLALALPRAVPATFLDAVLAETDEATITASDVGLARALGLYDLRPSAGPILPAELDLFVNGRLLEREALRLQIQPTPDDLETAWRGLAARVGGQAALAAWLGGSGVSQDWTRRLVEADLRRRQFIELRFRAFALVPPGELESALGPGAHSETEREAAQARLQQEAVDRALQEWLREARGRVAVRLVSPGVSPVPSPIPPPP